MEADELELWWEGHEKGNKDCPGCRFFSGFPDKCNRKDCAGLVHSHLEDEDGDGNCWGRCNCDECGEDWE